MQRVPDERKPLSITVFTTSDLVHKKNGYSLDEMDELHLIQLLYENSFATAQKIIGHSISPFL